MKATIAMLALLALSAVASAGDHSAPPAAEHAKPTAAPSAGRWAADAPLRSGMARIGSANAGITRDGVRPDAKTVVAAADEMRAAVTMIFAECKLAPEADAALHPLLARVLSASQALKDAPTDLAPAADIEDVLNRYRQLFDDPG